MRVLTGVHRRTATLGVSTIVALASAGLLAGCGGGGSKHTTSPTHTAATQAHTTSAGTSTAPAGGGTAAPAPAAAGWTQYNGNEAGTRDVNSSITSSNASKLGVAWTIPITTKGSTYGSYSTTPVVVDGVVYTQDVSSTVYAINLKTGKVLWRKAYNSTDEGPNGVNVVGGKVYGATATNAFVLSAKTGEQLWSKKLIRNSGEGIDMAPAVHDGTVYVSTVPGNAKAFYTGDGQAILWAMDASTGATKWKWKEVPDDIWGNKKVNSGGGQWQPPTFDAQGHLYLNVANPAPWVGDKAYPGKKVYPWGSSHPGRNLYTDSVVELNPANGKIVWYYQLTPHDVQDWDLNNQALISEINGKEAIISAGKAGIAIANDAQTGKLLWKVKMGHRANFDNTNIVSMHDPSSPKLPKPPYTQWPGTLGGVETPYASDGATDYFAVNDLSSRIQSQSKFTPENPNKGTGEMVAVNQATGKITWQHHFAHSPYGAAAVTNDLVFTTTFDGTVWALNKGTGAAVWHAKLPAGTNATVAVDGDTVVTGAGYPQGKGEHSALIAYRVGAHGSAGGSRGASAGGSSGGGASTKVSLSAGKKQFQTTCASCHTLAEAGTHGTVGPNLDQLKPSDKLVTHQVINGGGGMPAFGSQLSKSQIANVAAYVSKVAGTGNKSLGGKGGGGGGAP